MNILKPEVKYLKNYFVAMKCLYGSNYYIFN